MANKLKRPVKKKKTDSKLLENAPAERAFLCHDGSIFTNVDELASGLMTMSDDTFNYHSNSEKHDFSNWVRDIFGDKKLADNLAKATSRLQAAEYIAANLDEVTVK